MNKFTTDERHLITAALTYYQNSMYDLVDLIEIYTNYIESGNTPQESIIKAVNQLEDMKNED